MDKIIYNTFRGAYSISDIRQTMTVGEIIELLSQYDEDTPVYLSFDNGYTYIDDTPRIECDFFIVMVAFEPVRMQDIANAVADLVAEHQRYIKNGGQEFPY